MVHLRHRPATVAQPDTRPGLDNYLSVQQARQRRRRNAAVGGTVVAVAATVVGGALLANGGTGNSSPEQRTPGAVVDPAQQLCEGIGQNGSAVSALAGYLGTRSEAVVLQPLTGIVGPDVTEAGCMAIGPNGEQVVLKTGKLLSGTLPTAEQMPQGFTAPDGTVGECVTDATTSFYRETDTAGVFEVVTVTGPDSRDCGADQALFDALQASGALPQQTVPQQ